LTKAVADNLYESKSALLKEAVWWVDAGAVNAAGTQLDDLTGRGRPAVFGAGAAAPVRLPWDGENYVHFPQTASNRATAAGPPGTNTRFVWTVDFAIHTLGTASILVEDTNVLQLVVGATGQLYALSNGVTVVSASAATQIQVGTRYKAVLSYDYVTGAVSLALNGAVVSSQTIATPAGVGAGGLGISSSSASCGFTVYSAMLAQNEVTTHILDPRNVHTNYTLIKNTGSAGGDWTITRAATGYKTAVVDRPLILFGGGQRMAATMTDSGPKADAVTVIGIVRSFGSQPAHASMLSAGRPVTIPKAGVILQKSATSANATGTICSGGGLDAGTPAPLIPGQNRIGLVATAAKVVNLNSNNSDSTVGRVGADPIWRPGEFIVSGGYEAANQFGDWEFVAAAIFDRALSDQEIATVSQQLAGVPHSSQSDPHKVYSPLVAGTTAAALPVGAREGTIAILTDNTIAIRTRTGGWRALTTTALAGSPP